MPGYDAGDRSRGAGHGGRSTAALQVTAAIRAQRRVDQNAARRGREREDASDDIHGSSEAQVVRESPCVHCPRHLLQRLLLGISHLPKVRSPSGRIP